MLDDTSIDAAEDTHHTCQPPRSKRWHHNALWSCPSCGRVWVCRDVYDRAWQWVRTTAVVTAGAWNVHRKVK